jgi:hypothetical protein
MADTTLHYGSFIPEEVVTTWVQTINDYELNYRPELIARNILPYRDVGTQIDIDAITHIQTTSGRAGIVAKGASPDPIQIAAGIEKHEMYQIGTGFYINERDLAKVQGPVMKTAEINEVMAKIHATEDYVVMNGDSSLGINGIVDVAHVNTRGKVVDTAATATGNDVNNMGPWDSSGDTLDPYEDIVNAIKFMDPRFKPWGLVADRATLYNLYKTDSERVPFADYIGKLFGKGENDRSWMIESQFTPAGYAYVIPYSPQAAEFVVSQEIDIADDYAKEKGGNFWIEIKEWVCPIEVHSPEAFVEIDTTPS